MKIRQLVLPFLIVGILGSTVAEVQTGNQNARDSIPTTRKPEYEPQSIKSLLKARCERNGGPTGYEDSNVENSAFIFVSCVQEFVNLTQFEAEMVQARHENKELDTVIDQYCPKVPAFQQCVKNVIDSFGLCLVPQERTSLDIIFRIGKSMLKFACSGGKQKTADFLAAGGSRCVATKYRDMQNCFSASFPRRSYDSLFMEIPGLGLLPDLNLDVTGCNNIDEFRNCIVEVLGECGNPTIENVMGRLFDFVKDETSCKKLLEANSNATVQV